MGFHAYAMKTQILSAYNYYPKYNLSQKTQKQNTKTQMPVANVQQQKQVSFTGSNRPVDFVIRALGMDPLLHFEKFAKEEYSRLTPFEIEQLRKKSLNLIKNSSNLGMEAFDDIHNVSSVVLQDMFDKFFGAGEYVVITLGRSLSTIGKALGYRIGESNVVNMPMSSAKRLLPDSTRIGDHFSVYRKLFTEEGIEKFLVYLSKIGLGKSQVERSGKNYILMDYCFSGDSLKGAEFLFKSEYVWGSKSKVHTVDILDALSKYEIRDLSKITQDGERRVLGVDSLAVFTRVFCGCHYKPYSQVGRCLDLKDTEEVANTVSELAKFKYKERGLVNFRLLDNAINSQNISVPMLKPEAGGFEFSTQNIVPWRNYITQTESDLRNDIQRVNFQLLKLDALDICEDKTYNGLKTELNKIYNNLTDYYNTYKKNPYSIYDYYQARARIQSVIESAETQLVGKDIFAQ